MTDIISADTIARQLQWRHYLHSIPEIAFSEHKTADFVAGRLADMGLAVDRGLAGTGVVAVLDGKGMSDRAIALRSELDALPIAEANPGPYTSTHHGMMHACGHDGHMAMLLGAADHLSRNRDFSGRVVFVFQPAEENEGGGRRMVEDGLFRRFPVDAIYAVHNWPGLAEGRIAVQPGPMMARFDTFDFDVSGQGGHAALPHLLRDPTVAAGQLLASLQSVVARNVDPFEQGVVSVTFIRGGQVHNVVPDQITIGGTVRTFDDAVQDTIERRMETLAHGLGEAFGVSVELDYQRRMPATLNSEQEALLAQRAAQDAIGAGQVDTKFRPSMGAEDFSVMLQNAPGAYAWIGAGPLVAGRGLHQSGFDFNDRLLGVGAGYFASVVQRELHQP